MEPPKSILFVCTGNTCRSPMAAALMRRALDKRGRSDIIVESAGLAADGSPASGNAVAAMAEQGVDLSAHRSRPATPALLRQADILAVMSPSHAMAAVSMGADPAVSGCWISPTPTAAILSFIAAPGTRWTARRNGWPMSSASRWIPRKAGPDGKQRER